MQVTPQVPVQPVLGRQVDAACSAQRKALPERLTALRDARCERYRLPVDRAPGGGTAAT